MRSVSICLARAVLLGAIISVCTNSVEASVGGVLLHEKPKGPVKTVLIERAKFSAGDGLAALGKRFLMRKASFDERGNKVRNQWFASEDSHASVTVFRYDDDGRKRSEAHHGGDGSLRATKTYFFDEAGRLEASTSHLPDGTPYIKIAYEYDEEGHIVSTVVRNEKGAVLARHSYVYNDAGLMMKGTFESDAGKTIIEYNEKGDAISEAAYEQDDAVSEEAIRTFEYDRFGNWTKCTESRSVTDDAGKAVVTPHQVTYRTITYSDNGDE
jgi:hypothetical protein